MSKEFATEDLRQLLPFHVNGTLSESEKSAVDAALSTDENLSTERAAMARLRDAMRDTPVDYTPGEFGLARLHKAIDAEAPATTTPTAEVSWIPRIAAAAAIFALGLGAASFVPQSDDYIQASGSNGYDANKVLTITFQPDTPQGDVTDLFKEMGLVIVDGPSAIGLYRVNPGEDTDLSVMADRLLEIDGVIESVSLP